MGVVPPNLLFDGLGKGRVLFGHLEEVRYTGFS